jgi:beta-glucosidase
MPLLSKVVLAALMPLIMFSLGSLEAPAPVKMEKELPFPDGFWWGTALSAYQAEGGNKNSWTRWEEQPGRIKNNERSGLAANHWELYEKDFDNLVWLNANTHRLSIEWSRLEPEPGIWNEAAVAHYRRILQSLKIRGIRPVICLFHFTLPLWVEDNGGFENPENVRAFVAFAKRAGLAFKDLNADWLTLNEPVVYALAAYAAGLTPPGYQDLGRALKVIVNLMKAHGEAYQVLKEIQPVSTISFAHHLRAFSPRSRFSPLDLWASFTANEIFNWAWYTSIETGQIRVKIPGIFNVEEECAACKGALDYLGFNYYSRDLISVDIFSKNKFIVSVPPAAEKTDMGWEIYPQGLVTVLKQIRDRGLGKYPLVMTENGIADQKDEKRSQYLYDHVLTFLHISQQLGLKPMGYLHWSLTDNFEWIDGYYPRFGLFEVDYKTQIRKPRKSAYYFRELGARRQLLPPTMAF